MDNKKQDVTFKKTGSNGVVQMEYKRQVADFNSFIKSPEQYLKGKTVATNDKVSSKPGDKDYKQLIAKIKMVGERINVLSAMAANDPSKAIELNEAINELNMLNVLLVEEYETAQAPAAQAAPKAQGAQGAQKVQEVASQVPELENKLKEAFSKMSDQELEAFKADADKLKTELGVTDLTDYDAVMSALAKKVGGEAAAALSESFVSDAVAKLRDYVKGLSGKVMTRLGIGTSLAGVVGIGIGVGIEEAVLATLAAPIAATIAPAAATVLGGIALVVGIGMILYGEYKKHPGKG
jgi:hypothetical protein